MELNLTSLEKSLLSENLQGEDPFFFILMLRALARGDTALLPDCSSDKLLELTTCQPLELPLYQDYFHTRLQKNAVKAFPQWAHMEERIAREIVERLSIPVTKASFHLQEKLNKEQKQAVERALSSSLFFLTGGPGTGKTHTAGVYLKEKIALSQGPLEVFLLAPTGKAMKTLEKSIQRALGDVSHHTIESMTIHALLRRRQRERPLKADLVLIDEASMIDTKLMYDLLLSIDRSTPLLFIGDADQLPPVEPGQPFCDIVRVLEEQKLPFVQRLTLCERTDSKEIVECARLVLLGERINFSEFHKEIEFREADSPDAWKKAESLWQRDIFVPWTHASSLDGSEKLIAERVLLTAEKKASLGSNVLIARAETSLPLHEACFAPVLVAKNSYDLGVMNGDMGLWDRRAYPEAVHCQGRSFPLVLLERWEKAYALTVHKSQGSEFHEVHILVPPMTTLSRKMLYTAITRARRKVVLYGSSSSLASAIARREERMTSLPISLKKALSLSPLFE